MGTSLTPLRDIITVMMLSLRRRYLERQVDAPLEARGWRLGEAVLAKAEYNRGREWKHGGKRF